MLYIRGASITWAFSTVVHFAPDPLVCWRSRTAHLHLAAPLARMDLATVESLSTWSCLYLFPHLSTAQFYIVWHILHADIVGKGDVQCVLCHFENRKSLQDRSLRCLPTNIEISPVVGSWWSACDWTTPILAAG